MKIIKSTLLLALAFTGTQLVASQERPDSLRKAIDGFAKIEEKEVSEVNKVKKMFKKGKVSGQLKLLYAGAPEAGNAYATAVGGIIKYELAEYRGFNAGAAVYTSYDIPFASGEDEKRNTEISSEKGNYADINEAYLNYKYEDFNFRAGRQAIDTPLADTDNIRMIQNTFEAYIATYELAGFSFMAGNLQNWNGTDAGLEDKWQKTGTDGTNFGGVSYADGVEFNAWYYNITGLTNAAYFDLGFEYAINEDILLHVMTQYLLENELENSGIEASIYGFLGEVVVHDIGFRIAMNQAQKKQNKGSFSGFGGGALFTNMDTMIMDEITQDREVLSIMAAISYSYKKLEFLYAYGDFNGAEDGNSDKAHIAEQNIAVGYNLNDDFAFGALFAMQKDLEDSQNDWNRLEIMLSYNF